jgi:hypothetical protein
MSSNIDHIIDSPHDEDISLFVNKASIPCEIIPWKHIEIRGFEFLIVLPEGKRRSQITEETR